MYSIYLIKFTNYAYQFHEVHLGEISPKCTRFHNIKILPRKNIPLNVLFPLNILTTVYATWIWNKFTQVWGKVDFRKDITYVTTTPLPVKPRFQAGLTFMSNPPRAPRFKCHCCANIGSLIKEPCRLIRVIW